MIKRNEESANGDVYTQEEIDKVLNKEKSAALVDMYNQKHKIGKYEEKEKQLWPKFMLPEIEAKKKAQQAQEEAYMKEQQALEKARQAKEEEERKIQQEADKVKKQK